MMKYDFQLLIFDWDGTLMDSEMHIVQSMKHALRQMGRNELPHAQLSDVIGLGMREALDKLFPDGETEAFFSQFLTHYRQYFFDDNAQVDLFKGAFNTIQYLHQAGYKLAVATGKSRMGLDIALSKTQLEPWFHASRCADETESKPSPLMIEEILEETNVEPSRAVMIGDTEYDLKMAANADIASIGVSYGVHEVTRLEQFNPITTIDNIQQLPGILR